MTVMERNNLESALESVKDMLDRARYMMQEITEDYFERFDPHDREGQIAITYEFPRKRAFALAAEKLIFDVIAELPQPDWVSKLQDDGGKGQNE